MKVFVFKKFSKVTYVFNLITGTKNSGIDFTNLGINKNGPKFRDLVFWDTGIGTRRGDSHKMSHCGI